MASVLAAARYYRIGFSLYLAVSARRVRVPGGSKSHLEPGTIRTMNVFSINIQDIGHPTFITTYPDHDLAVLGYISVMDWC